MLEIQRRREMWNRKKILSKVNWRLVNVAIKVKYFYSKLNISNKWYFDKYIWSSCGCSRTPWICICDVHTYINIYKYMRDRDGRISTSEGSLISAARRTARIWMPLQHPRAYGHLYSYRKSLWNTPLRLLILTPWIILGFRSYKRAQRSCSSSSHLSLTIWWHCRNCRFFAADLQRYDTAPCRVLIFYFYRLNILWSKKDH